MRPIRSLLFAPGNRPDLLRKFVRYNCDAYVIDLEDATPAEDKANARAKLADVVRYLRDPPKHRVIAAYQAATANGFGAIECDGALVDEPMLKRAEAVVAMAARSSSEA